MISDKKSVQYLHRLCLDLEVLDWIISPGSRNAAITLTIANDERFTATPVVDERSAAFIALGRSLKNDAPSAITCTSGSASLNYAPAIAEAYYQEIPLLIVTADRPQKWIDNGEGQSIDQVNVYQNFCLASFHINEHDDEERMTKVFREVAANLFGARRGPVHLNLAFEEPLYNKVDEYNFPSFEKPEQVVFDGLSESLVQNFNSRKKVMVLVGQMQHNETLSYLLKEMLVDKRVTILTETNANMEHMHFVSCIDRTLPPLDEDQFHPELVITLGGAIVSKRIKKYLRSIPSLDHWHVSSSGVFPNTFECLSQSIAMRPETFFRQVLNQMELDSGLDFQNVWVQRALLNQERHNEFLKEVSWSDFKVHALIYDWLPDGAVLHQGNSSVVRYFQLFDSARGITYQSNRGVSGIDGIVSTALGYASVSEDLNVVVVGDLSFQYDINALWNKVPKDNFLIIVINNGGGGIFKIIEGPISTGVEKEFFEVRSNTSLSSLAEAFGVNYAFSSDSRSLERILEETMIAFASGGFNGLLLEVDTTSISSEQVLKDYFIHVNSRES